MPLKRSSALEFGGEVDWQSGVFSAVIHSTLGVTIPCLPTVVFVKANNSCSHLSTVQMILAKAVKSKSLKHIAPGF
jgi:hypothetical protein